MRLAHRIAWAFFLLLWVGAIALWARSYWRTDDLYLIYRGDGSEHLRIRRGMLALIHTAPAPGKNHQRIQRLSIISTRDQSQRGGVVTPQNFSTHKQWLNFSVDGTSARQIVAIQQAQAASARAYAQAQAASGRAYAQQISGMRTRYLRAYAACDFWPEDLGIQLELADAEQQLFAAQRIAARSTMMPFPIATRPPVAAQWQLIFPAWSLLVIASTPSVPCIWWSFRKRRRMQQGLCGACGYDLRANVSGVCPECGKKVPA